MIPSARPIIGEDERRAVDDVLVSGGLAQGEQVAAFEAEFSGLAAADRHCVAVNSGTSALHISLLAAGIGPGDEVIVPSFTFAATANAVALTGAIPVFADIEPEHFCLDPDSVVARISPRTRAVIPVHLYGHPAQITRLRQICDHAGLLLIEDAAQAHLASLGGQLVGTFGVAGCFSFYPTKNMTSGEGGMIVTADAEFARAARLLRNQGQEIRYHNEVVGLNNRMTDIHAAIGRVQLRKLQRWTIQRRENAAFFDASLRGVVVPPIAEGAMHSYHQYTIRVVGHDRDAFADALAKRGVGSGVYYPVPVHRLPSFGQTADLPNTEVAAQEVLSLPVHPALSPADLEAIAIAVNDVAGAGA